MRISYFKNIFKNESVAVDIFEVYEVVRTHAGLRNRIENIRQAKNRDRKNSLKKQLPAVTVSGLFADGLHRENALIKHSGLLQIDIDKIGNTNKIKELLISDIHTQACFISPSGNGLKAIFKIPPNAETHRMSFDAVTKYLHKNYGIVADRSTKDISRLMFLSFDAEIYININSKLFSELYHEPPCYDIVKDTEGSVSEIFNKLVKWTDKTDAYTDGNKHNYLVRLTAACNRFGISEQDTVHLLTLNFQYRASFVKNTDFEKLVKSVYRNYSHDFNSQRFEAQISSRRIVRQGARYIFEYPYNEHITKQIKKLPAVRFNSELKKWTYTSFSNPPMLPTEITDFTRKHGFDVFL